LPIPLSVNGAVFNYPVNFDTGWGIDATGWAQAVTAGMLQKAGGTFPLTADVDFGDSFGLIATYFTSDAINPATSGTLRLASADPGVGFRNNANNANLILTTDASDNLLFNGHILGGSSAGPVTSIIGTANQVIASSPTGNVTLSLPQSIAPVSSPTFAGITLSAPSFIQNATSIGFQDSGSAHTIAMKSPNVTTDYTLTLPPDKGLNGQVLRTDGTGVTTWVNAAGSGTVNSGTAGQLAYYATSSNVISGNPSLLYTETAGATALNLTDTASSTILLTTPAHQISISSRNSDGFFTISDVTNSRSLFQYDPINNFNNVGVSLALATPLFTQGNKIEGLPTPTFLGDALAYGKTFDMGSTKITGLAAATTAGDAVSYRQGGQAIDGSTANASGSAGTIQQGTISTPDLRANAVTNASFFNSPTLYSVTSSALSLTLSGCQGGNVFVLVNGHVNLATSAGNVAVTIAVVLFDSGTQIASNIFTYYNAQGGISPVFAVPFTLSAMGGPISGSHTYTVQFGLNNTSGITGSAFGTDYSFTAIEFKR
jgi:hypothetical protein